METKDKYVAWGSGKKIKYCRGCLVPNIFGWKGDPGNVRRDGPKKHLGAGWLVKKLLGMA